jgi:hypothetical protein
LADKYIGNVYSAYVCGVVICRGKVDCISVGVVVTLVVVGVVGVVGGGTVGVVEGAAVDAAGFGVVLVGVLEAQPAAVIVKVRNASKIPINTKRFPIIA